MKKCIASVLSLLLIFSMVGCSDHSSEKERPFVNDATAATFDWIYRIVFNPTETVKDGKEITALFGAETVSINGINYNAADETDYSDILEWAESKYHFFNYELQPME